MISAPFQGAFEGRRVLVTGHTGFKGSWLTAWLLRLGAEVSGYALGVPTTPSLFEQCGLADHVDHLTGDVRDVVALREAMAVWRPDFVFHMAAQSIVSRSYGDPLETLSVNVLGTASVLEALRGVDWDCGRRLRVQRQML